MPLLVMPTYQGTLLDRTYKAAVQAQIAYGDKRGVPWGMSESGYNAIDIHRNYQYCAFGVPSAQHRVLRPAHHFERLGDTDAGFQQPRHPDAGSAVPVERRVPRDGHERRRRVQSLEGPGGHALA